MSKKQVFKFTIFYFRPDTHEVFQSAKCVTKPIFKKDLPKLIAGELKKNIGCKTCFKMNDW